MKLRKNLPYIIAACLIIAVIFFIISTVLSEAISTEPVVLPPPAVSGTSSGEGAARDPSQSMVEINADTVQAAISILDRPDSYFRTLTVERFWSGGGSTTLLDVYVDGESSKTIIYEDGAERHILIVSGKLWMWRSDESGVFSASAAERDADLFQSIPTYEDILSLSMDEIVSAGYEEFGKEYCIFVKYISGHFGYETTAYISPDSGLLVGCTKYDGENLIYAVTSSALSFDDFGTDVFTLAR